MKTLRESLLDDEDIQINDQEVIRELAIRDYFEKIYDEDQEDFDKNWKYMGHGKVKCIGFGVISVCNYGPEREWTKTELSNPSLFTFTNPEDIEWRIARLKIKDLTGLPKSCDYLRILECPELISLKGAPKYNECAISITRCPKLKTLEGISEINHRIFLQNLKSLLSFEGLSNNTLTSFDCTGCHELISLKGLPEIIDGGLHLTNNKKLSSIEYLPKQVNGVLNLSKTQIGQNYTEEDIRKVCKVKNKITL